MPGGKWHSGTKCATGPHHKCVPSAGAQCLCRGVGPASCSDADTSQALHLEEKHRHAAQYNISTLRK